MIIGRTPAPLQDKLYGDINNIKMATALWKQYSSRTLYIHGEREISGDLLHMTFKSVYICCVDE